MVYDGFAPFELGVACEVFGDDRWVAPGDPWYRLFICGDRSAPVTADGGFQVLVPHGLEILSQVDTVIVTPTYRPEEVPPSVFEALRQAHARGCRILSLCSGAFVLAEAGLLDGRRAATHWTECDELARLYPEVLVDPGVLYVDEGDILTSAGSAAGIDLCLHVVRQDYGSEVATQLARQLVVPPQRDGGQAQFIEKPLPVLDSSNLFADTLVWLQEHLDEPLTVEDLATRSAMSPRTFARQFLARHRNHPVSMAAPPACPARPAAPRGQPPVYRGGGREEWLLHRGKPAQAFQPDRPHQSSGLSARLSGPEHGLTHAIAT